ncbi:MAG TPA: DUF106 domain-containing protein [Candidatus Syntrophoarchaeum butanivorans]|uniref:DUF106 domain-containing protein n=1 Tax=Candidatus Syntropharchaeum butanivorans TaxID=1839936 RepID=A0A7C0X101_9EURY|nr:MAG: hypothetical protein DRO38_03630 [Candidatus Bathyarchaeota archaeon]HDM36185.1 DUF106 domain-containing protein [Candidatus Syntrophoarchaeum butanivorans]
MEKKTKELIDRVLLALGFSLLFGVMLLGPEFRDGVGSAVGILLDPVAARIPFHHLILILAIVTGIYSGLIQKYTIDWELMRRVQRNMREFQREFREAQREQNKYKLKKLQERQVEMMQEQAEISKQQFKPMAYTGIITIPIWMWMYQYVNIHRATLDPLILPMIGERALVDPWFFLQYWIVWYIICSIPFGALVRKILGIGGV